MKPIFLFFYYYFFRTLSVYRLTAIYFMAKFNCKEIFEFTNVEDFTFKSNVNRAVNATNVKKFYNLMKNNKFDPQMGVVVVDLKSKTIIDGQHRIKAYDQAKTDFGYKTPIQVRFVEAPTGVAELQDYIRHFQNARKWQLEDYISANLSGKNDLERLMEFCLSHPNLNKGTEPTDVFWRKGAAIIAKTGSSEYKNRLKQRNMRFTKEEWEDSEKFYKEVTNLFAALGKSWTDGGFEYIVNAWKKVRYDMDLFYKICRLPSGIYTFFDYLRENTYKCPSGQGEGVWYDFFVNSLNELSEDIELSLRVA